MNKCCFQQTRNPQWQDLANTKILVFCLSYRGPSSLWKICGYNLAYPLQWIRLHPWSQSANLCFSAMLPLEAARKLNRARDPASVLLKFVPQSYGYRSPAWSFAEKLTRTKPTIINLSTCSHSLLWQDNAISLKVIKKQFCSSELKMTNLSFSK